MENENYANGRFSEDYLGDPSLEFNLDLQHALLGDYNLAGELYCSDDQLKRVLFDEDEGFDEDYDDEMLQHAAITGQDRYTPIPNTTDTTLAYANTSTVATTTAASSVMSFMQAGSHDHDQCLPDNNIDDCYGNSIWTNDAPMQLISTKDHMISTRDHMISSPVKLHEVKQLPRESSPPTLSYQEQSLISHDRLPSHEELISMPFYKFKRLLDSPSLSSGDKREAKAIRKKGKNKSAARHCRERKMAMLEGLEQEVAILQQQRESLLQQKAQLFAETKLWETKCSRLQ